MITYIINTLEEGTAVTARFAESNCDLHVPTEMYKSTLFFIKENCVFVVLNKPTFWKRDNYMDFVGVLLPPTESNSNALSSIYSILPITHGLKPYRYFIGYHHFESGLIQEV